MFILFTTLMYEGFHHGFGPLCYASLDFYGYLTIIFYIFADFPFYLLFAPCGKFRDAKKIRDKRVLR